MSTVARPLESRGRVLLDTGLVQSHGGQVVAMQTLAAAKDAFMAADDDHGVALSSAALMVTGHALLNFRDFPAHLDSMAGVRDGSLDFPAPNDALLAVAGLLVGLLMYAPADPLCGSCVDRILPLLGGDADPNLKLAAGRIVLFYTEPRELRELGDHVNALIEPLMNDATVLPHRLGRWLIFRLRVTARANDPRAVEHARRQAHALVARCNERDVVIELASQDIEAALAQCDFARADEALRAIERASDPANLAHARYNHWVSGRLALARGDGDAALFHAQRARRYSDELAIPGPMYGVVMALEAQALLLRGDFATARDRFAETAKVVAVLHADEMRDMIRMVDAYEAIVTGRHDARARLADAFAAPRARQYYDAMEGNPRFAALMCAHALEHGVEVEFVGRIISLHRLAPPADAGPSWPWPVCIRTFGHFEVLTTGTPVASTGKAQRKPLDLLRLLIAAGGHGVDKRRIADSLWPDALPEAATAALDMAISRLRKLLGCPEALTVEEGKLDIATEVVWIDRWAFERAVDALQRALREPDGSAVERHTDALLDLYRGAFLEHEEPHRWLLAIRERCRNRFLRSMQDAGHRLRSEQRFDDAARLYERALDADPLAEELYLQLMRCRIAQGRETEAVRVYQRCKDLLDAELAMPPSAETQLLYRSIARA
jgi:LuxR family maltose regulon positive regulatory protein